MTLSTPRPLRLTPVPETDADKEFAARLEQAKRDRAGAEARALSAAEDVLAQLIADRKAGR